MGIVIEETIGSVRILQLNHRKSTNPFSEDLEEGIKAALSRAQLDPKIRSVVVTGGNNRSFSAGGDFSEVKNLATNAAVDRWIDRVTELYASALKVDKPTVAAIDGFAIGMGFQFAMMFDWRVMARGAEFQMPELKYGIGCSVGGAILSKLFSLNVTRQIIYACDGIDAERALSYGLVDEIVPPGEAFSQALKMAGKLSDYPDVAFRATKRAVVADLLQTLYQSAEESKKVHRAAFAARAMQSHFNRILGAGVPST
jgi:carboxymethylproline synthase